MIFRLKIAVVDDVALLSASVSDIVLTGDSVTGVRLV